MEETHNQEQRPAPLIAAATALAAGMSGATQADGPRGAPKAEERMPLFWRVFGGTVLSIAALLVITLWQQFTGSLQELRGDLNHLAADLRKDLAHLSEAQGGHVKKEDFNTRILSVWDSIKDLRDTIAGVTALKERAAMMEQQLRAEEAERKEVARQLQELREARAAEAARRETSSELQRLRERLAALEGRQTSPGQVSPAVHREE